MTTTPKVTGAHARKPTSTGEGTTGPRPGGVYRAKAGDTLRSIAEAAYGDGGWWQRIAEANRGVLGPKGVVAPGASLRIPKSAGRDAVEANVRPTRATDFVAGPLGTLPPAPPALSKKQLKSAE